MSERYPQIETKRDSSWSGQCYAISSVSTIPDPNSIRSSRGCFALTVPVDFSVLTPPTRLEINLPMHVRALSNLHTHLL